MADFFKEKEKRDNNEKKISKKAESAGGGQKVEVFVVGFVVEKIPFGNKVMFGGAEIIVGIGEGFDAGTKDRIGFPDINGSLPDNLADVTGFTD